uniref:Uncharacterized protein n=1 Tax=Amazona collaria TaxID=241587 RepID=A0A8B9F995_9PSIT
MDRDNVNIQMVLSHQATDLLWSAVQEGSYFIKADSPSPICSVLSHHVSAFLSLSVTPSQPAEKCELAARGLSKACGERTCKIEHNFQVSFEAFSAHKRGPKLSCGRLQLITTQIQSILSAPFLSLPPHTLLVRDPHDPCSQSTCFNPTSYQGRKVRAYYLEIELVKI